MRLLINTLLVNALFFTSQLAQAFTLSCNYGAPPPNSPPGTTNPTVYSRLDWTTSEQAIANGILFSTVAYEPGPYLIGYLYTDIGLPQQTASWYAHVVVLGSPYVVGEYSVISQAYSYQWFLFEGGLYRLQTGIPQECAAYGQIP